MPEYLLELVFELMCCRFLHRVAIEGWDPTVSQYVDDAGRERLYVALALSFFPKR